ncbi:hypothetical protein [Nocardia sp. CY41]|uniref:hypothetical protein n=1 Tax=Nocardia sp. CY41 TaxID=2608686 RepID=UPI00135BB687|nr:hypothetical protein [Nocardia sp. CY41]
MRTPPVVTGLGAKVDALVALSPKTAQRLDDIYRAGYTIRRGSFSGGSYMYREEKTITIALDWPRLTVASLLHELGHAHPDNPAAAQLSRPIPYRGEKRDDWVEAAVALRLRDEAHANFIALEGLDEIRRNGGPLIHLYSANARTHTDIYDRHRRGELSKEDAINQMARLIASEKASTTGQKYEDYYGDFYRRQFVVHEYLRMREGGPGQVSG